MAYSRRVKTEAANNKRKAYFYIGLTVLSLILIATFGLPLVARFSGFLTELRGSSTPVESSDSTPPPPPRFSDVPEFTKELRVELEISTEPGAIVILELNDKTEEVIANNEGKVTYEFALNDGENTVSAKAKDSSGNESQESEVYTIIYDDEPPELEIIKPNDKETFYGSTNRQIVVEGTTDPDTKIQINNRQVVVEEDGGFTFATTLAEGENTFVVKAEDEAGNLTEKQFSVTYSP